LKITVLCQYYQTSKEPGISLLGDMVEDFVRRGHEVYVVAGRYGYMDRAYLADAENATKGYVVHRSWSGNEKKRDKRARIGSFVIFASAALAGLFSAGRCDLVFASSPSLLPMMSGWLWAWLCGAKFVIEVRDLWPESAVALGFVGDGLSLRLSTRLARFLYRRSDGIVALTNGIAGNIRDDYKPNVPIHVARCAVVGPAAPISEDERQQLRAARGWTGKCIAIYLGTIGYANDIECVVDAASLLSDHPDLRIVVVGDGPMREVIRQKSAELANFELLAPVAKAEIASYLAAADIGLCPLRNAALFNGAVPTKLIDYMAFGLPVVAAGLTELAEIVSGENAGLLYAPGNAAELAAAVASLANDRSRRHTTAENARRSIRGEFLLEQRHDGLAAFIDSLFDGQRPRDSDGTRGPTNAR
jgi:glycosyltransferase involved in cell wall biosynthesis